MEQKWEVELLTPEKFLYYWPQLQIDMDRVSDVWARHWTKDSIFSFVMNGAMQCWGTGTKDQVRSFLFTQIAYFPTGPVLHTVFMIGNSMPASLPMLAATLERYAICAGCTWVEIVAGRRGWGKFLAPLGFTERAVVYMRDVTGGKMQ